MKISQKTKKYLKITGVALLLLFAMNRCTVACNRGRALEHTSANSVEVCDSLREVIHQQNLKYDSIVAVKVLLEKDTTYLRSENAELRQSNQNLVERVSRQQVVHNHYDQLKSN